MGYSVANVDEIEPGGPGGAVRFVRRELGVKAFGINWFELPPNAEGHEHDHVHEGQEEVNVIARGRARIGSTEKKWPFAKGCSCGSIRRRRNVRSRGPTV